MPRRPTDDHSILIIDSHIHLYPQSEIASLAWCPADHPLHHQHSVNDYLSATRAPPKLRGFIFIEADRKSSLTVSDGNDNNAGWASPLDEVAFAARIATGQPRHGEGHLPTQAPLCLAIIPWAPVPQGADALARYVELVKLRAGSSVAANQVKGFRYLVQDKPRGTMLQNGFVEGLRWLGRQRFVFELGVDFRSGGDWQLEEAEAMLRRVNSGLVHERERVLVVINHMAKPDLSSSSSSSDSPPPQPPPPPRFLTWASHLSALAAFPNTVVKLSGGFSEMSPEFFLSEHLEENDLARRLRPYFFHVLGEFGERRVLFGSDWPVCDMSFWVKGDEGKERRGKKEREEGRPGVTAWGLWQRVVGLVLEEWIGEQERGGREGKGGKGDGWGKEVRRGFWGGNARWVYGVS